MSQQERSASRVYCLHCGERMEAGEAAAYPNNGPRLEMYACPAPECGHRAALMFEPSGPMTPDQASWVEREVARRGAFFPTDWTDGGGGSRFGR